MTAASPALRFWVDMTLECIRRDHTASLSMGDQRGPFLTARALGMATAALNDAKALAEGRAADVLLAAAATPGLAGAASSTVAAAAACAQLLRVRYPKQARMLDPAWLHWLDLFGFLPAGSPSELAGRGFGDAIHLLGGTDASIAAMNTYTPSNPPVPYQHIAPPTEPTQRFAGSSWGTAPWLALTGGHIAFPPPPGRTDATTVDATPHYAADYAKVVTKGVDLRSRGTRDADEEIIGIYWGYDGPPELGTPPRLYMQVVLTVLDDLEAARPQALSVDDELKVIAGAGIAMADAGIEAWHYKYSDLHMMWRPVVGIRQANPAHNTPPVPGWLPLGRPDTNNTGLGLTPDFPAYPSGHATFGAAAFQVLRLFLVEKGAYAFGATGVDNIDFDFVSDEYNGRNTDPRTQLPRELLTRRYSNLWQAIVDNSISRVFLGVHWQFDGITKRVGNADEFGEPANPAELGHTGGVWLGGQIANAVALKMGVLPATIAASKM